MRFSNIRFVREKESLWASTESYLYMHEELGAEIGLLRDVITWFSYETGIRETDEMVVMETEYWPIVMSRDHAGRVRLNIEIALRVHNIKFAKETNYVEQKVRVLEWMKINSVTIEQNVILI